MYFRIKDRLSRIANNFNFRMRRRILSRMHPTRSEMLGAATLFLVLALLVVALVYFAIPPGGAPTLK